MHALFLLVGIGIGLIFWGALRLGHRLLDPFLLPSLNSSEETAERAERVKKGDRALLAFIWILGLIVGVSLAVR